MKIRRCTFKVLPLWLAACLAGSLYAQAQTQAPSKPAASPAPATTLHVDATMVTMAVTVRDKHGAFVPNLTKDDFTLAQDNHPQTIKYFAVNPNMPLTLGLLVDVSGSQRNQFDAERSASQHFLDSMLTNPNDRTFLIQFAHEVDLLADITTSKSKLDSAINQLGAPQIHNTADDAQDSGDNERHMSGGGGTTLYDAIYLASDDLMMKQPDRKALIVLTDGVDRGSKETLFSAIEAAQRANTVVYAIYFKGEESGGNNGGNSGHRHGGMGWPGGGYPGGGYPGTGGGWPGGGGGRSTGRPTEGSKIDGKKILEQICGETGGYMFEAGKKASVDQIYSTIASELRSQYILGYTPGKQDSYSGYHRITLTTKKKDLIVQTRQGYYAGDE